MTETDLARLADDGCPHDPDPPCCGAAAELASLRRRVAVELTRPWRGPETTHVREAVRRVFDADTEEGE